MSDTISRDDVQAGDTITWTPRDGKGTCTGKVDWTDAAGVHVTMPMYWGTGRYKIPWGRITGHQPKAAAS